MKIQDFIIFLFLCCSGCFPETFEPTCEEHQEAERIALGYEELFEVSLTNEQFACMHDFRMAYGIEDEIGDLCHLLERNEVPGSRGCFRLTPLRPGPAIIMLPIDLDETEIPFKLRHELIHLLVYCLNPFKLQSHRSHNHPAFHPIDGDLLRNLLIYAGTIEYTAWDCSDDDSF